MTLGQLYLCSCIRSFGTLRKISRIRCVLSRILHSVIILEYFFVVKETTHHQNQRNIIFFYKMMNLFNFPSSNKVLGLGRSIFCETFTTSACRVSQNSSSSRYSFNFSSLWFWVTIPTMAVFRNLLFLF
jgi:hypothetical protein